MIKTVAYSPLLRAQAHLQKGRRIGLYGGSFNPAHAGHAHVANKACQYLGLDEIWILVTPGNPLKHGNQRGPLEKRVASVRKLVKNPRAKVYSFEKDLGLCFSIDTIESLLKNMPLTEFIWIMGADNLQNFHHWKDWRLIATALPIAIFDRPRYSIAGLRGKFAGQFARDKKPCNHFRKRPYSRGMRLDVPAWGFFPIPRHPTSATEIRSRSVSDWWSKC